MSDTQAIRRSGSGSKNVSDDMREQDDLWRQAENDAMPLSELISHVLFAATVLVFYFFGSNEFSPFMLAFMWLIASSSSRYRRQQAQIGALRELLRRAASRR